MASRVESPEVVTDSVERRDFLFLVTGATTAIGHLEICACNESSANDLRFCDGGAAF